MCVLMGAATALAASPPHVLVLPFARTGPSTGKSSSIGWIGESVSEAIREALANSGLMVTSREERQEVCRRLSVRESALLTRATILKIGQTLDVDLVIFGGFQQEAEGGRLRIHARMLNIRQLLRGPEFSVTGALAELSNLQQLIAWEVLHALTPETAPASGQEFLGRRPVIKIEAMEQYVGGLLAETPDAKYRFLVQAARLDERFAPARFELGRLQFERNNYRDAIGWLERIPSSDALHYQARFLAGLAYYHLSDYGNAENSFELIERELPLAEVFNNMGAACSRQGKQDEALRHFEKACAADPREAAFQFNRGYALWRLNRLPAAAAAFRQVLERSPEDPEASLFLQISEQPPPQAQSDPQFHARERLRSRLEESAYRQLTAILQKAKKSK